ncbi:heterogeneous nuclear ribonucleoprotein U-like protein 2 [Acipenser oxyrinchus oxyrinchus]|uniref:Heterogeneous nuclear ribonucleoprotein U-like protein 2 n=1 Tax=Acipenser oxyrinchus oxyrinchus TaxID=40147 RepID=A0AAD8FV51_ACIOX|nr:heterogeneous nuclear ribonucleoprotein U-like protein 2 [Acipenser oxyrinchus oxyrinchus]
MHPGAGTDPIPEYQCILEQAECVQLCPAASFCLVRGFSEAVVVCPSDEEWKRRLSKHQREEGEEVAETSLLKVKVSFTLPSPCEFLEEVLSRRRVLPPPKRKKNRNRRKPQPQQRGGQRGGAAGGLQGGYGGSASGYYQRSYGQQSYWGGQPQHREQDYRPFCNQYRTDYDRFYGRNYDPQRYREYYRQYTREWNQYNQDQDRYGYGSGNRGYSGGSGNYGGYR